MEGLNLATFTEFSNIFFRNLVGGFKKKMVTPKLGEMIQIDELRLREI